MDSNSESGEGDKLASSVAMDDCGAAEEEDTDMKGGPDPLSHPYFCRMGHCGLLREYADGLDGVAVALGRVSGLTLCAAAGHALDSRLGLLPSSDAIQTFAAMTEDNFLAPTSPVSSKGRRDGNAPSPLHPPSATVSASSSSSSSAASSASSKMVDDGSLAESEDGVCMASKVHELMHDLARHRGKALVLSLPARSNFRLTLLLNQLSSLLAHS